MPSTNVLIPPRTREEHRLRRIINSTYITLDGVIANPQNWPSGRMRNESGLRIQTELLLSCDAVLMGRRTYETFAAAWPTRSGDALSDRMNSMKKYVVSSTLQHAAWNNTTIVDGDPIERVKRLKAEPGQDIVQYGFGPLSFALVRHGLLDELRLWVHPFLLGRSGPDGLLYRESPTAMFKFVSTTPLENGDVILTYEPA
jgi:dihydrofolate reductase